MTTVQFETVANSIAGISITGITLKTPDAIPLNGLTECPYFAPRPDDFITEIALTRESYGTGGSEKMNLAYTMNWQYFHAPITQIMNFQTYGDILVNIATILQKIADNDAPSGAVDIQVKDITRIGPLADVAGNSFHGANIAIRVLEFING